MISLDERINDKEKSEIDALDEALEPQVDSIHRIDVERFIFGLTYLESIILVFLSLGHKRKEIRDIIGYKRVGNINQAVLKLRERSKEEQF